MRSWVWISIALLALSGTAQGDEPSQFIFAWPLDEKALKPRGATTRGAPVVLDTAPAEAWRRLNEPGLSALERDRRAILAMAGPYRVSFDFLEVVRFDRRSSQMPPTRAGQPNTCSSPKTGRTSSPCSTSW